MVKHCGMLLSTLRLVARIVHLRVAIGKGHDLAHYYHVELSPGKSSCISPHGGVVL